MAENTTLRDIAAAAVAARGALAELDAELKANELDLKKLALAEGDNTEKLKAAKQGFALLKIASEERKQSLQEELKALDAKKKKEEEAADASKRSSGVVGLALRAISGGSGELAERFTKIKEGFKTAGDSSQSMGTRIAAGASSAVLAAESIGNLGAQAAQAAQRMLDLAVQAEAARLAQERLANAARAVGPGFEAVTQATHGAIEAADALALRNALLDRGLSTNGQTLAATAQLVRRFANENGTTAADAIGRLTQALDTGDRVGLARFGLASVNAATTAGRLSQAVDQVTRSTDASLRSELTAAEQMERRQRAMQAAPGALADLATRRIALLIGVRRAYEAYATSLADTAQREQELASRQQNAGAEAREAASRVEAQARAMGALATESARVSQALKQATTDTANFNAESREGETMAARLARRMAGLRGLIQQDQLGRLENHGLLAQMRAEGASREEIRLARGRLGIEDTGPQALANAKEADRSRAEALRTALSLELQIADVQRNRGESDLRYHQRAAAYLQRTIAAYQQQVALIDQGLAHVRDTEGQRRTFENDLSALAGGYSTNESAAGVESAAGERVRGRRAAADEARLRAANRGFEQERQESPNTVPVADRLRLFEQRLADLDRQLTDAQRTAAAPGATEADQAAVESLQRRYDLTMQNIQATRELAQAQRENNDVTRQVSQGAVRALQLQTTSAQQWGSFTEAAVGGVTSAFKSHFQAMIQGKESVGQALEGMLSDVLQTIATEAAVRAIFGYAKGLADLAMGNYPGAAMDFASAAAFTAVAALAGGAAYGLAQSQSSTSGSTAPAAGGGQPASTGRSAGDGGSGGGSQTFNFYSGNTIDTRESIERGVRRVLRSGDRLGLA